MEFKKILLILLTSLLLYKMFSPVSNTECNAEFLQSFVSDEYEIEEHRIETYDNHFIRIFRVRHTNNRNPIGSPILMQHGLACNPVKQFLNTPDKSPALAAAKAGYFY